jgi:biotin operon repressor
MKKRLKTSQYSFKWRQKGSFLTLVRIIGTALAKEMGISRAAVYKILKEESSAIIVT